MESSNVKPKPESGVDDLELLFFDTFSHEASEELNLDLVQFPKPVLIGEVRIIPLGARVQADFPGGVRLGATNPSQFDIEFFVNDLSKPGASTFEKLGIMDYNQNGNIHLDCQQKTATDGLVLRGLYTTITLAIYGCQTKAAEPPDTTSSAQPQGQPSWNQTQVKEEKFEGSHYASYPAENFDQDFPRYPWQPGSHLPGTPQSCPGEFEGSKPSFESQDNWEARDDKQWVKDKPEQPPPYRQVRSPTSEYRERGTPEFDSRPREPPPPAPVPPANRPPSPPTPPTKPGDESGGQLSPGSVESISEGDIPEEDQPQPFEPLSDDDLPEFTQFQEMDLDVMDSSEPVIKVFDPFKFEVKPFKSFRNPIEELVNYKSGTSMDRLSNLLNSLCNHSNNWQNWIEIAEEILALLPAPITHSGVENKLVEAVMEGLEWNCTEDDSRPQVTTRTQDDEPVFKVRRLKLALRLAEAAVSSSSRVATLFVAQYRLHQTLFQLYHIEWMALSLKLLMLRVVDMLLCYEPCLEQFVKPASDSRHVTSDEQPLSGYQHLVVMLQQSKTHARIKFSLASLITKIHFYQLCDRLRQAVKSVEEKKAIEMFSVDLCLEEIYRLYKQAPKLLCQPKRFLPVSAVFENPKFQVDPRIQLYSYFTITDLIRNLSVLMANKQTSRITSIVAPVYSLMTEICNYNHGLVYLSYCNGTNKLLKSLDSNLTSAYKLKTLSILDELNFCKSIDKPSTIDALQSLYTLTINPHVRKTPVLEVLTYSDNLSILLDILIQKSTYKKKSPSRGYIIDLIVAAIKTCSNVEYLKRYAHKLLELSKGDFTELKDVNDWLKPCLLPEAFNYDNITPVYDFVKNNVDNCTDLPGDLITTLRLLKSLGIPHYGRDTHTNRDCRELKYKYVILQIYSLDGLSDCTNILNKICDKYDPVVGVCPSSKRSEVVTLVLPVVELMRRLLTEVISTRGSDFKDATSVGALLSTYQLVSASTSVEASCARQEIIQALLAYTQAFDPQLPAKSAWSLMATEVVNWCSEAPRQIATGLSVLSELLPLPLPLICQDKLSEEEVSRCVGCRRAWAAVLAPAPLPSLLAALAHTAHKPTAEAAHAVALRYADLAAPSALALVKAFLETPVSVRSACFLSSLASHPPVKAALIQVLEPENWAPLLTEQLESLLPAIQSLCDCEISLLDSAEWSASNTSVASNLPPSRVLAATIPPLLRLIQSPETSKHSVVSVLRTFCLLAEHDYGLYHLHKSLEIESGWCVKLVESNDNEVLSWVVGLGLALGSSTSQDLLRIQSLSTPSLRSLYKYSPQEQHLHPLNEILKKESKNNESIDALKKSVENLLNLLNAETSEDSSTELTEPVLDGIEPILSQFASRKVFIVLEKEESEGLSSSFWMSPSLRYSNIKDSPNQISIDLSEIAKNDLKGWDLNEALTELCSKQNPTSASQSTQPKPTPSQNKPAFVGANRGGRGGTGSADVFRSRAANTSRPPSLHVDDFVALETCGAQPTGPTGYNKLTMMAQQVIKQKDILGMRGQPVVMRGGGRPMPMERPPRFFVQPYLPQHHFPPYYPPHHPHF